MCKTLLSINPIHVENILNGTKKFEFRKVRPSQSVDTIVIYSTAPVMKVVAEVKVIRIIEKSPNALWRKTRHSAGISKFFFNKYYKGKKKAVAFQIGKITIFKTPKLLSDYGIGTAPQSFVYLR